MQPNGPVAGGRDLIALQVQELIGGDIIGQNLGTFGLQDDREDDAVKDDVVLSDEM